MSDDDPYGPIPLVACSTLHNIGIYVVILFIISLISNITVIYILIRHRKSLLTAVNIQILCVSILNLIGTLVELPMVGIAAFVCRFIFGIRGCILEGYPMLITSLSLIHFYLHNIFFNLTKGTLLLVRQFIF